MKINCKFLLIIYNLNEKMKHESSSLNFEKALIYKNIAQDFNNIKKGIMKYKEIMNKDIYLKLPIENGYKLFFISKGHIILKEKYLYHDIMDMDDFIKRGTELKFSYNNHMDEKSHMDYRDILYSEITYNLVPDIIA